MTTNNVISIRTARIIAAADRVTHAKCKTRKQRIKEHNAAVLADYQLV